MTFVGTCHFVSRAGALRYYASQEHDKASVDQKLKDGSIKIGCPKLNPGEKLVIIADEQRYAIGTN